MNVPLAMRQVFPLIFSFSLNSLFIPLACTTSVLPLLSIVILHKTTNFSIKWVGLVSSSFQIYNFWTSGFFTIYQNAYKRDAWRVPCWCSGLRIWHCGSSGPAVAQVQSWAHELLYATDTAKKIFFPPDVLCSPWFEILLSQYTMKNHL